MTKFQQWARDNYRAGEPIDELWHPEIQKECEVMMQEEIVRRNKQKEEEERRSKEVVASVADLEESLKGKIVIYTRFNGTVTRTRALSGAEKGLLAESKTFKDLSIGKPLFTEFPELKELENQIHAWRESVKKFGIPFFGRGMTVIDIRNIPEVERLFDEIDKKLPSAVDSMLGGWDKAVEKCREKLAADGLGALFNPDHYDKKDRVRKLFGLTRKWMPAFDVPDILKEVDMARWEAERKRSAELWAEVRQNGIVLLREELSSLTDTLLNAVTPNPDGTKKRFYSTSLTNMKEFFDVFEKRNLAGDSAMTEQIEKLRKIVEGRDLEGFKENDQFRAEAQRNLTAISASIQNMLVESGGRKFELE